MLNSFWDNLGLELLQFNITTIDIDKSTEEGEKIAKAIATQASMSITGHTWQQEEMFKTANNAVDSFGSGNGGLIGGIMAINMMGGIGGGAGVGMIQPQYNQPTFGGNNQGFQGQPSQQQAQTARDVYCSNCSKKFSNTLRFCPHCGDPYNPCPKCGTDNDPNSKRCVSCGTPLTGGEAGNSCPNCNAPLQSNATFCGNCGKQLQSGDNCSRCGTPLQPNVKFCPKCGNKR